MLVLQIIRVAFRGMLANTTRTLLTMLGIVVGVGSVIVLIAFSEGTRKELLEQFEKFGAKRMGVWLNRWNSELTVPSGEYVELEDIYAILDQCPTISRAVPVLYGQGKVRRGNNSLDDHSLYATEPDYFEMHNLPFASGAAFTEENNILQERVCVLGSTTKYNLFFEEEAVGEFVLIDGKRYLVVGVMAEKGGERWQRADEQVVVPFFTGRDRSSSFWDEMEIAMEVTDTKYSELAEQQVREVLHLQHPLIPVAEDPEEDPFNIWNVAEWQAARENTANSLGKFLVIMGALSLLIGGVGVMNIMLVTVQERTREIGLRKAVGASGTNILSQFLIESVSICLIGGALGTLGAIIATRYMARLPDEAEIPDPIVSSSAIAIAVVVTVSVGLFFGVYPASRAARLDPISALHCE